MAREVGIEWFEEPKKILEWNPPYVRWFVGAKYNIAHDAVDKQAKIRKNKVAYIWEGEPGEIKKLTYGELYVHVNKLANVLKAFGIGKGDRVAIWLPMIPELSIAMLACAKVGAIHSVVFSGFSEKALLDRIQDSGSKLLITADGFYRNGKVVKLKNRADTIIDKAPSVKKIIVYERIGDGNTNMSEGRDYWWHEVVKGHSRICETEVLVANDLLFILYTSGTTGKPKGVMHVHGGYAVGTAATLKYIFDIKEDDIWWCSADIGWMMPAEAIAASLVYGFILWATGDRNRIFNATAIGLTMMAIAGAYIVANYVLGCQRGIGGYAVPWAGPEIGLRKFIGGRWTAQYI